MWQEIVVALLLIASLVFLGFRLRSRLTVGRDGEPACGCECQGCGTRTGEKSVCQEPLKTGNHGRSASPH
jgi:hypothetical protein